MEITLKKNFNFGEKKWKYPLNLDEVKSSQQVQTSYRVKVKYEKILNSSDQAIT